MSIESISSDARSYRRHCVSTPFVIIALIAIGITGCSPDTPTSSTSNAARSGLPQEYRNRPQQVILNPLENISPAINHRPALPTLSYAMPSAGNPNPHVIISHIPDSANRLKKTLLAFPRGVSTDDAKRILLDASALPGSDGIITRLQDLSGRLDAEISIRRNNIAGAFTPGRLPLVESDPFSPDIPSLSNSSPTTYAPHKLRVQPTGRPLDIAIRPAPNTIALLVMDSPQTHTPIYTLDGRLYVDSARRISGEYGPLAGVKPVPADALIVTIAKNGAITANVPAGGTTENDRISKATTPLLPGQPATRSVFLGRVPLCLFASDKPLPLTGNGKAFLFTGNGAPPPIRYPGDANDDTQILSGNLLFPAVDITAALAQYKELSGIAGIIHMLLSRLETFDSALAILNSAPVSKIARTDQIQRLLEAGFKRQTAALSRNESQKALRISGQIVNIRTFFETGQFKDRVTIAQGTLQVNFSSREEAETAISACLNLLSNIMAVHRQNLRNMYQVNGAYAAKKVSIVPSKTAPTGVGFEITDKPVPFKQVKPQDPKSPLIDPNDPEKRVTLPNVDEEEEMDSFNAVRKEYRLLRDVLQDISGGWIVYPPVSPPFIPPKPDGL